MFRSIHSWLGLLFAIPILLIAISGAILATKPVLQSFTSAAQDLAGVSVAQTLERITTKNPRLTIDRLRVTDYNVVLVKGKLGSRRIEKPVNITTGELLPTIKNSPFYAFVRDLHREMLVGKTGRIISLVCSIAMLVLLISGTVILLRRMGGFRGMLQKIGGKKSHWLHSVLGRALIIPLLVTAMSGVYLGLVTQKAIPSGAEMRPYYPETSVEAEPVAAYKLAGLQNQPLQGLRELLYPIPGDWFDVYALKTDTGFVFFDQFTGALLSNTSYSSWQIAKEWISFLHTGEGSAIWAVLVGLASSAVPVFIVTGIIIWWRRRGKRVAHNVSPASAEFVLLVGSENGSTFGFAKHLHEKLTKAGKAVHMAAMDKAKATYPNADTMLVLAATYGDGHAPQNAGRFLNKLQTAESWPKRHAVLAFGDRNFPKFCSFGRDVDKAMSGTPLLELGIIDRQSSQSFSRWGRKLAAVTNLDFELDYKPPTPKTARLYLLEKIRFGQNLDNPSAILRLGIKSGRLSQYRAGDLIGIFPDRGAAARIYSLGSSSHDNFVEICVAQEPGGLCSTMLNNLPVGGEFDAYIMTNPNFSLPKRGKSVVMIGAGTGIAPFAGMIRHNQRNRPIDLFWGNRHPESDFYYENDISEWLDDGRLSSFYPAFSRVENKSYVQDQLSAHTGLLVNRLRNGGTIMVCGGSQMAAAVHTLIDALASQMGSSLAELRHDKRYLEDIY